MRHTGSGVPEPDGRRRDVAACRLILDSRYLSAWVGRNRVVEDESRRVQRSGHVDISNGRVEPYV